MKGWLVLAGLAVSLSSCLLENSLGGSLGEVFPLDLSTVDVHQNEEALQVTYFRNRGVFLDVVVRVSISLQDDGVSADGGVQRSAAIAAIVEIHRWTTLSAVEISANSQD